MEKEYILFDLDGTISDPAVGITKSVQYSLKSFGIDVRNTQELLPFIGPPLRESYQKFYGFSEAQAEQAVAKYREYFAETGIFENTLYDGMRELLEVLQTSGKTLIVATSKPIVYAVRILEHFEIDRYFAFVAGSELDGTRSKKSEVIAYALENCEIAPVEQAVMIGDREHDVLGAKALGMQSVGVLYGYGDREELAAAGANYIAASVGELVELLGAVRH